MVYLIVDQLRGDMLDRYAPLFTGGFKRLMEEGLYFTNALHDHAQTETSPGHASISTGVYPTRAGIPANAWREGEGSQLRAVFNVADPGVGLTGIPGSIGSSPNVLRRTGLADWVKGASPDAKVVSVSAKDRAAILLAGKSQGEVYWFDSQVGRFVTSTFYRSENPSWLERFNEEGMEQYVADSVWNSIVPPHAAHLSAPDTASFEGDGVHTFFPHEYLQEVVDPGPGDFFLWFEATPMLDKATLDVTLLAIEEEGLGKQEGRTDFLAVSFSQVDRVGHAYGPLSREQLDNLLRLDSLVGEFLSVLDREVGQGNYVLGFTSDHGVLNMPERVEGGGVRLTSQDRAQLEEVLSNAARQANLDRGTSRAQTMVNAMKELPFIGPAYTQEKLAEPVSEDSLALLVQHSYTPGRGAGLLSMYGIEMWWAENTLTWGMPVGTTHGSPYHYDRWVPLVLMGPGIQAARVDRPVRPMDLAPTLAGLAGIPMPIDLDGNPILLDGNPILTGGG